MGREDADNPLVQIFGHYIISLVIQQQISWAFYIIIFLNERELWLSHKSSFQENELFLQLEWQMEQLCTSGGLFFPAKDIEERRNYANLSIFLCCNSYIYVYIYIHIEIHTHTQCALMGCDFIIFWPLAHSSNCTECICTILYLNTICVIHYCKVSCVLKLIKIMS